MTELLNLADMLCCFACIPLAGVVLWAFTRHW